MFCSRHWRDIATASSTASTIASRSPSSTISPSPRAANRSVRSSEKVTPAQAQDAISVSASEARKGNKTPQEHKEYSKQVQQNIEGAKPARKSKLNIRFNVDLGDGELFLERQERGG